MALYIRKSFRAHKESPVAGWYSSFVSYLGRLYTHGYTNKCPIANSDHPDKKSLFCNSLTHTSQRLHPFHPRARKHLCIEYRSWYDLAAIIQRSSLDHFVMSAISWFAPYHTAAITTEVAIDNVARINNFAKDFRATVRYLECSLGDKKVDAVVAATDFAAVAAVTQNLVIKNVLLTSQPLPHSGRQRGNKYWLSLSALRYTYSGCYRKDSRRCK